MIRFANNSSFLPDIPQKELINFYWFCKSLFVCRIALFSICKLNGKIQRWWTNEIFLSVVFIVMLYALSRYAELWGAKNMMQYYVLGYVVKKYNVLDRFKDKSMIIAASIAIVALAVLRYSMSMPILVKVTSVTLPLPIITFVYYVFKRYLDKEVWRLTAIGRQSLLIYLLHIALLGIVTTYLKFLIDISEYYHLWFWLLFFVVLTELSLVVSKAVKDTVILRKIILLKK